MWERYLHVSRITSVFQPIVHLTNGQVIAYEILSRITDEDGALIPIELLFMAAEQLGKLYQLDLHLLKNSLQQILERSVPHMRYFINVMPESLRSRELLFAIKEFVRMSHGNMPIVLEISEFTADPSLSKWSELLAPYRQLGVEVAIDDVGSGYAGLNRTVEISPDWMKLDIGLVRDVDINAVKAAMIASVVTFTKRMTSIRIIAEGIETEGELQALLDLGIEVGQGFLMAKPARDIPTERFLQIHEKMEPPYVEFDQLTYGLLLAQYLEKVCFGYQNEQAMAIDACHYIKATLLVDHVEVLKVSKAGVATPLAIISESVTEDRPDIPFDVMKKMIAGEISISQDTQDEERPYSHLLNLRSSLKVPIFVRGKVYGLLFCGYEKPYQIRSEMISVLRGIAAVLAVAMVHGEMSDNPAVV